MVELRGSWCWTLRVYAYALCLPTIRIQFPKLEVPVMLAERAETTMTFNSLVLRRSRVVFHFIGFNFCVMALFYSLLRRSQSHLSMLQTLNETVNIFHCKWLSRNQDALRNFGEWNRAIFRNPRPTPGLIFCQVWLPRLIFGLLGHLSDTTRILIGVSFPLSFGVVG